MTGVFELFFFGFANGHGFFAVEPDLMIGFAVWCQVHSNLVSNLLYSLMRRTGGGCSASHDITIRISTCCESREQGIINILNRCANISLDNSVQLKPLSCGNT